MGKQNKMSYYCNYCKCIAIVKYLILRENKEEIIRYTNCQTMYNYRNGILVQNCKTFGYYTNTSMHSKDSNS